VTYSLSPGDTGDVFVDPEDGEIIMDAPMATRTYTVTATAAQGKVGRITYAQATASYSFVYSVF